VGFVVRVFSDQSPEVFLSEMTKKKVANGPKNIVSKNQLKPDLFFPCAIPAFINVSVPHPTAY